MSDSKVSTKLFSFAVKAVCWLCGVLVGVVTGVIMAVLVFRVDAPFSLIVYVSVYFAAFGASSFVDGPGLSPIKPGMRLVLLPCFYVTADEWWTTDRYYGFFGACFAGTIGFVNGAVFGLFTNSFNVFFCITLFSIWVGAMSSLGNLAWRRALAQ